MTNKYNAKKTEVDGFKFDSKKEAERYQYLKVLLNNGEIEDLELQPPFKISVNGKFICKYIADFRYKDRGKIVIEDVKGYKKSRAYDLWRLKWKLLKALEPDWVYKEL